MEKLQYDDKEIKYDLPSIFKDKDVTPVTVEIGDHDETVVLKIGDSSPLVLSMDQARDLALALRKTVNKIQKATREKQWIK